MNKTMYRMPPAGHTVIIHKKKEYLSSPFTGPVRRNWQARFLL